MYVLYPYYFVLKKLPILNLLKIVAQKTVKCCAENYKLLRRKLQTVAQEKIIAAQQKKIIEQEIIIVALEIQSP